MQSKYDFMRLNENGRFEMCPRCGNANISEDANYCKICGFWLFNNCNNQSDNTHKDYCGRINDGDARYCEHCGSETFLMNQGLLKTWEELLEQYDSVNKVIDQAAASLPRQNQNIESIDIPDDELPF